MGFLADDSASGYVAPNDIIDVGEVLTPGEDYQYVGGGGAINIPYFPSITTPIYVPPSQVVSQSPTNNKSGETWVYVVMIAMMMIMVIVLAVVL
jgi:hypothetical protein